MDFLDSLADIINDDLDNIDIFDDELMHYGTPRHSGRYPWGSGENPYPKPEYELQVQKSGSPRPDCS